MHCTGRGNGSWRAQDLSPRPQMVAGHTVSDDGRTWQFPLREGVAGRSSLSCARRIPMRGRRAQAVAGLR